MASRNFADHPLEGLGSGGFQAEWLKRDDRVDAAGDAHSLYLETAAELGVVGLASLLLFLGGVAAALVRLYRLEAAAATGLAAGLAAWAFHAGLDWDWEMPAVTLPALLLAAAAVAWSEEDTPVPRDGRGGVAGDRRPGSVVKATARRDAPVLVNARAAARREIGGVERVAIEMAARLPRLNPARYAVARPPTALAYKAGHVWEQALLPAVWRTAGVIYSPANLAPVASRRNVVVINDLAALRHPGWYSSVYAAYQKRIVPTLARRARRVIAPSKFSRRELSERLDMDPSRIAVVPHGVDERFSPDADAEPVRRAYGLERPYILVVGSRIARKNLPSLAADARAARGGRASSWCRPDRDAGTCVPVRPRRCERSATSRMMPCPGSIRGRSPWPCPPCTRASACPCSRRWPAAFPWSRPTAPRCRRPAVTRRCWSTPMTQAALGDALLSAATDQAVRKRLVPAGIERAAEFSWDRSARLTDHAIGDVLAEG